LDEHAESNNQLHYEELYRNLIQEMELMHKDNLVKLRVGFRSLLIVPTIFLILLFFTGSSKTIFLILWIVSMFIISFYLVRIEYSDYQLQGRINKATDREGEEATSLVLESIESNRNAMHDLLMREESRLPFRFGFEAKTAGDESEYHEDVLPLYTDNADIEAFGDEDALGHDDEEYDYAPVSGLSEDEDFLPGADSYTMEDFDAEFGVSTPAKDEMPIAVLDDGVDGIDTLVWDEDTVLTAAEPAAGAANRLPEPPADLEDDEAAFPPESEPVAVPAPVPAAPVQAPHLQSDPELDGGADGQAVLFSWDDDYSSLSLSSEDDSALPDGNDDTLPAGITVDDILSEFHKSEQDADYEADFSDLGDYDGGAEGPDTLGDLSDDTYKDGEL